MGKRVLCPNCGIFHTIEEDKATFESNGRNWLKNTGAMVLPGPPVARPAIPPGMPNYESHVAVPRSQAQTTGFFAGMVGGLAFYGLAFVVDAASKQFELTGWGLLTIGAFGGGLVGFSVTWWEWKSQLNKYDGLLYRLESWTGIDLDGNGEVGQPEQTTTIPVEITENGIPRERGEIEGVDIVRLRAFAHLLINEGKGFSERTAADAGISQEKFYQLRDGLVKRGWAAWKHPNEPRQGVALRPRGEAIFKALLSPARGKDNPNPRAIAASSSRQQRSGNNIGRYEPIERN